MSLKDSLKMLPTQSVIFIAMKYDPGLSPDRIGQHTLIETVSIFHSSTIYLLNEHSLHARDLTRLLNIPNHYSVKEERKV